MAILHRATITPTKDELLAQVLGGPVEQLGAYRFDDPAGEVGVEGFVVRLGDGLRHVVFTYRGAPLEGEEAHLVGPMEHSALGTRWVYDGAGDPVALACFRRALKGEQEQARLEIWDGETLVGTRESTVTIARQPGVDGDEVWLLRDLDEAARLETPGASLLARWDGGEAVVAVLEG